MARYHRVKELLDESTHAVNEAQVRDASPNLEQLMEAIPLVQQAVGGAMSEAGNVAAVAKSALDAIASASQTAQSTGVEQNAIIDNIAAMQEADPSQSVITLTDHRPGVQQAYYLLSTIKSTLNTANILCTRLNALAARQFL